LCRYIFYSVGSIKGMPLLHPSQITIFRGFAIVAQTNSEATTAKSWNQICSRKKTRDFQLDLDIITFAPRLKKRIKWAQNLLNTKDLTYQR
jgi:hypothetical protein